MMENYLELVFILDRSGSMAGLEGDTIGGFNAMLEKQKQLPGKTLVTTVLFDHEQTLLHSRLPLMEVPQMTEKDYWVRGSTAMLDALGGTIRRIQKAQQENPAERTLVVITTDGLENSSTRYGFPQIRAMIADCPESWEFLFLGANMDAAEQGSRLGISRDHAVTCCNDPEGVALNYQVVGETILKARACAAPIAKDWKEKIEGDFRARGKK